MDNQSQVSLPARDRCLDRLRVARFGETVTCVKCESEAVVKRGKTGKGAQQYWCKRCETYFNDLTDTIFGQHRFALEEMFYIIRKSQSKPITQIAQDLNRDYGAVLAFVHKVRDRAEVIDEFDLSELCTPDDF